MIFTKDFLTNLRTSILIFIDLLGNLLTLEDANGLSRYAIGSDVNYYIVNDVVLYLTFRIINDEKLNDMSDYNIRSLVYLAIQNNTPDHLTNTLLKYVDTELMIGDVLNRVESRRVLNKPQDYVSFFQEDV